jgi:hypothetical protein
MDRFENMSIKGAGGIIPPAPFFNHDYAGSTE